MAGEEGGDGGDNSSGWIGAIGAAALGGLLSSRGQDKTNEANKELGREQMAFQERMSGSAYQRAVKDMAAAGINPMLVSQVGGATSPSGAMPQIQNSLGAGVSGAQQAMAAAQQYQAIANSKAQAEQFVAQANKMKSETMDKNLNTLGKTAAIIKDQHSSSLMREQAEKTNQEIRGTIADATSKEKTLQEMDKGGFAADVKRKKAEADAARYGVSKEKAYSDYYEGAGKYEPYIGLGTDVLSSAAGVRRAFGTNYVGRRK